MKKLLRNLLILLVLIGLAAAVLPYILSDDEDYEVRLVGAIVFVEGILGERAAGSHHRLYEPELTPASGENSWVLEARVRSTDEFNQERYGVLSARLTTLCRPFSIAACWRLDEMLIDGARAQLDGAAEPATTPDISENDTDAQASTTEIDSLSEGAAGPSDALDTLESAESDGDDAGGDADMEDVGLEMRQDSAPAAAPDTAPLDEFAEASTESSDVSAVPDPTGENRTAVSETVAERTPPAETSPLEVDKDTVTLVQRQLDRLGYNTGPADGVIGPRTERAIKTYQEDHAMAVTGQITQDLLRALQIPQTANNN